MFPAVSKRVYISVINDLVTDQRIRRTANLLADRGASVTMIGRKLKHSTEPAGLNCAYIRFNMLFTKGPLFYAFFNFRLFFLLLTRQRPELLISNDLDTLPASYLVAKIRRIRLLYDSHEYFTEVPELINRRWARGSWTRIEKAILPDLDHAITVSESIAGAYREKYGTDFRVVRNLPVSREPKPEPGVKERYRGKGIIIYQGSLNMGRGLEMLIDAMVHLEDMVLLIAGDGDITAQLKKRVIGNNLKQRIHFLGRILPDALYPVTCSADLGVTLEEDLGLNYRYALPNKMFDYIQARIPVLCSDLPEMKALVEKYSVGEVLTDRNPEALAGLIRQMLKECRQGRWQDSLEKAAGELCWEKEKEVLSRILDGMNV